MKIFLIILSILLSNNQQVDEIFKQSNDYYTNGDYEAAVDGYLEIINSGFDSAELYFNIGNSFYKLNNIPESNFYFEKALALSLSFILTSPSRPFSFPKLTLTTLSFGFLT